MAMLAIVEKKKKLNQDKVLVKYTIPARALRCEHKKQIYTYLVSVQVPPKYTPSNVI